MRKMIAAMLAALIACSPAVTFAETVTDSPDLPVAFFNAIPDICFQVARGHPPTVETAASLLLQPTNDIPATVKAHYSRVTSWFQLKAQPNNVFIGIGNGSNACHVVLANTRQTGEVQHKVIGILSLGGFRLIQSSAPSAPMTDMLFVKPAPDGYMLISIQAPHDTQRNGEGDQGAVHVNLMPKAMFEALLSKH
ncbi:MAG: hypothetical protein ACTHM8_04080 [Sphingomonas sp.]